MANTCNRESSLEMLTDDFGITKEDTCHSSKQDKRCNYLNGPDQVIPSDTDVTTKNDVPVNLRMGETGLEAVEPISIPGLLQKISKQYPNRVAMVYKDIHGTDVKITYKEYQELVHICAKAFIKLGLKRYDSVGILGFNSVEWVVSYLAAIHAGGCAVGIHATNNLEACHHCLEHSNATIVVVDEKQLEKILQMKNRLPRLQTIIQYSEKPMVLGVYSWDEVLKMSKEESDVHLSNVLKTIAVNECCSLIYTSGTVGFPKAAMMSHDNITWTAKVYLQFTNICINPEEEYYVSYFPLSHITGQVIDIFAAITVAGTIYIADKDALKGSLLKTLHEVRPTVFMTVPHLLVKIQEKLVEVGSQNGIIKEKISSWARNCILQHNLNKMNGQEEFSLGYAIASGLINLTVKKALGFDRCKLFVSGSAPLSSETRKFFMSLDINIMNAFGMTEGSGAHPLCLPTAFNLESVGKTLTGIGIKIDKPDKNSEGEICCYGRNVFMGYLNDPIRTVEAIDESGWLHTGDLGRLDKDGFLYVTGRSKELIIITSGENIPPVHVENLIKSELICVNNAVLIGDKREFLTVLLTLKTEVDMDTREPKDELTTQVKEWCKNLGCEVKTVTELLQGDNEKVMCAIQEGINRANNNALSQTHQVEKFAILPNEFSISTGELGPTLKLKRDVIVKKYADTIEKLYRL